MMPHSKFTSPRRGLRGTTTVVAMVMIAALASVAATTLLSMSARYNSTAHAVAWRQAMDAAESTAQVALTNLRRSVRSSGPAAFATNQGWSGPDANGTYTLLNYALQSAGHGANRSWGSATIEAPVALRDARGTQWYRIRATGYTALPGQRHAGNDSAPGATTSGRNALRKLDYRYDHFASAFGEYGVTAGTRPVGSPQATRRLELIVQPHGFWTAGVIANQTYDFPLVDSFDSTDPAKSNADGTYNASKRQSNGDVVINSTSPPTGQIYGNASINADGISTGWGANGSKTGINNVTGEVSNNVYIPTPPVTTPAWSATATNLGAAPSTIVASGANSYFKASSLQGTTITLPAGQTSATVHVYVSGDITQSLTIAKGVTAKLYFAGNFNMKARDMTNLNNRAVNLQFYGIDPPAGQTRTVVFGSGNPGFRYAAWYAPGHDFTTNGNPDFVGSFVCKSFTANGNCSLHYDESLAGFGSVAGFVPVSWVEDNR